MAKPTHTIYHARRFEVDGKQRSEWTKLGVLFATPKGAGFQGTLNAFPVDGRIIVLPAEAKEPTADTPIEE